MTTNIDERIVELLTNGSDVVLILSKLIGDGRMIQSVIDKLEVLDEVIDESSSLEDVINKLAEQDNSIRPKWMKRYIKMMKVSLLKMWL